VCGEAGFAPPAARAVSAVAPTVGAPNDAALDDAESAGRPGPERQPTPTLSAFVEALLDSRVERFAALAATGLAEAGDLHRFEDAYLAPAARLLGELWLSDECDFLAVTIAVARLERLFMGLAMMQHAVAVPAGARRVLLAPAPGNQHSFGLALVEERFRHAGWAVDCCGAGDGQEMLRLVAASPYDVIGLSVHSEALLPDLTAMIARLRKTSSNRAVVILGGGSLALENARLLLDAGFDRLAEDAASAVRQAEASVVARMGSRYRAAAE
jgi:methylmalonyl-CoA mutase cobalamin-binding subunit